MVIQKKVNGFEAVNYFRKNLTSGTRQGSEKASAILI